jgi:hypothetical protein
MDGTERGCPTRSSLNGQMSAQNNLNFRLSDMLRLGQPRSAVTNLGALASRRRILSMPAGRRRSQEQTYAR